MEEIIRLTDQDIGDAITNYIGLARGQSFFPYNIKTCKGMIVSPEVEIALRQIPKGTKVGELSHNFHEE